jgi:hypothetical protein
MLEIRDLDRTTQCPLWLCPQVLRLTVAQQGECQLLKNDCGTVERRANCCCSTLR